MTAIELHPWYNEYCDYVRNHKRKQNKGAYGSKDSERQKCYDSEFAMLKQINTNTEFVSIEDARQYAKKIYKTKTWEKLWRQSVNADVTKVYSKEPEIVAKFRNTGRGTAGFATMNKVTLDTQAGLNKYVLLHELTHTLGHMHHGRSFRKTLLGMVGTFMGAKEKAILQEEFKKRKLAFGDARKPLEFDAWVERKSRLTGVRIVFGEDDE